jgi:hypothetical protein
LGRPSSQFVYSGTASPSVSVSSSSPRPLSVNHSINLTIYIHRISYSIHGVLLEAKPRTPSTLRLDVVVWATPCPHSVRLHKDLQSPARLRFVPSPKAPLLPVVGKIFILRAFYQTLPIAYLVANQIINFSSTHILTRFRSVLTSLTSTANHNTSPWPRERRTSPPYHLRTVSLIRFARSLSMPDPSPRVSYTDML